MNIDITHTDTELFFSTGKYLLKFTQLPASSKNR